ncbi:MAG: low molecular weight protein-tyrosine-phosphatase [Bacteroidota bacterium]
MKILMVCLGNICRSPLAEGIMYHKIQQQGLDWEVDSAGTGYWHVGEAPDQRSILVASKNGIDISQQKARQFDAADLNRYDLIYAMDASNYRNIIRAANSEEQEAKVDFILNMSRPGYNQAVPDPYYGGDQGFEEVFRLLDEACEAIIEKYKA